MDARIRALLMALLLCTHRVVTAATDGDGPICADRPGKSSQACTVPAGHLQFESSFADWTLDKSDGERDTTLAIGETGFKYGLTDRSHIDIDVRPWVRATSRVGEVRGHSSGFGDVLVSYKYRLMAADSALLIAVSPFVKVPTAKRSIGNGKWEGGLIVPIQYAIRKTSFVVSLTPEIDWNADSESRGYHLAMANVANLAWQITDKLNLSGEIWWQREWDPAKATWQASADGAIAYLVNNKLQLDAGANLGLNRNTPDVDVYVGFARQF